MVARNVLFVTWDGPGSPFLETLFLPIFQALRASGYNFHVLQFTWAAETERAQLADACASRGIPYRSALIWRRHIAVGSLIAAVWGALPIRRAVRDWRIDIVMPRSTLPATATRLALTAAGRKLPVLFDADGLPHDERIELGRGDAGDVTYRILRRLEKAAVRRADAVTVRTSRAADILAKRSGRNVERFHVVANARDADLFRPLTPHQRAEVRRRIGVQQQQPLLVYAASALGWKNRPDATLCFFEKVCERRPQARLLLIMPDHRETSQFLRKYPEVAERCILLSARPDEVPEWLGACDLGMALMHASFSMQAVAPIKIGEYLLCGVPALVSSGIGDFDGVIEADTGLCLGDLEDEALACAARWFVEEVLPQREAFAQGCRALGLAKFSLDSASGAYRAALEDAVATKQ